MSEQAQAFDTKGTAQVFKIVSAGVRVVRRYIYTLRTPVLGAGAHQTRQGLRGFFTRFPHFRR